MYPSGYDISVPKNFADYLNDFYLFNISERSWFDFTSNVSGVKPSPRVFHGLASSGSSLYVFGGKLIGGKTCTASPIHKNSESGQLPYMVLEVAGFSNDLYKMDISNLSSLSWTSVLISADAVKPSPRSSLGFCALNGKLYVFGGYVLKGIFLVQTILCTLRFELDPAARSSYALLPN